MTCYIVYTCSTTFCDSHNSKIRARKSPLTSRSSGFLVWWTKHYSICSSRDQSEVAALLHQGRDAGTEGPSEGGHEETAPRKDAVARFAPLGDATTAREISRTAGGRSPGPINFRKLRNRNESNRLRFFLILGFARSRREFGSAGGRVAPVRCPSFVFLRFSDGTRL